MKMCLVMILVKKVFIFSKTMIICLLCPLLCGLFFFWKGAKGELSYKMKNMNLLYMQVLHSTINSITSPKPNLQQLRRNINILYPHQIIPNIFFSSKFTPPCQTNSSSITANLSSTSSFKYISTP